jgi:hypothetical protein
MKLDYVTQHNTTHKYQELSYIWVKGNTEHGEGAFKTQIIRQIYEQVTPDLLVRSYLVFTDGIGYHMVKEDSILADYNNTKEIQKIRIEKIIKKSHAMSHAPIYYDEV